MSENKNIDIERGNRIRMAREAARMHQIDLAIALGEHLGQKVSRGAVGNWELGKGIKLSNLNAIAEICKVPVSWLATGEGEPPISEAPKELSQAEAKLHEALIEYGVPKTEIRRAMLMIKAVIAAAS